MLVTEFVKELEKIEIERYVGVPDSALKPFCDYLNQNYTENHIVPANEGAAVGIAIGSYLASKKLSCVYMQNSGIGNIVNPVTSLANAEVYDIPMLFLVGFRGEPGIKDEPQHKFMGKITEEAIALLGIKYDILSGDMTEKQILEAFRRAADNMKQNRQYAFIIKKNFFKSESQGVYENNYKLVREDVIACIIKGIDEKDAVVSTTGKISREVYEQSDIIRGHHKQDFLTVGGMGHASMIALALAKERNDKMVYCIDGDGAILMHMGSLGVIAKQKPNNLVHICLNNEAHESVGGMPTGNVGSSYADIADACGYENVYVAEDIEQLEQALEEAKRMKKLTFIEVKVAIGSRNDLGRPKETPIENKNEFMKYHKEEG